MAADSAYLGLVFQSAGRAISFIAVFVTTLIGAFLWYTNTYRYLSGRYHLASFGLLFLIGFVINRVSAFHHVDEVIQYNLHEIKTNWMLELAGIYMIIAEEIRKLYVSWTGND